MFAISTCRISRNELWLLLRRRKNVTAAMCYNPEPCQMHFGCAVRSLLLLLQLHGSGWKASPTIHLSGLLHKTLSPSTHQLLHFPPPRCFLPAFQRQDEVLFKCNTLQSPASQYPEAEGFCLMPACQSRFLASEACPFSNMSTGRHRKCWGPKCTLHMLIIPPLQCLACFSVEFWQCNSASVHAHNCTFCHCVTCLHSLPLCLFPD